MEEPAAFNLLMDKNLPHILVKIFLFLDYESLKSCHQVCRTWNKLLRSEYFSKRIRSLYYWALYEEEVRLCRASGDGNIEEVRRLLSSGMLDVNAVEGKSMETPLGLAAQMGHEDVVQLLLDGGAKPDKTDLHDSSTPLHQAVKGGHSGVVKRLLDGGAEPNYPNFFEDTRRITPLHLAVTMGHNEMSGGVIEVLLKGGADPNLGSKWDGKTPLHSAAICGNLSAVKLLIENGANPNKLDCRGMTPLKWAKMRDMRQESTQESQEVVKILKRYKKKDQRKLKIKQRFKNK